MTESIKIPTPELNEVEKLQLEVEVGYKALGQIFKNAPDGPKALAYLQDIFGGVTIGYDLNGAVDPNGTLVKNGHREVLDHIEGAIEDAS